MMTRLLLRHNKAMRTNTRARDIHHMDNIIDEYLSLDLIQKQLLFSRENFEFNFKKGKRVVETTENHSFRNIFAKLGKREGSSPAAEKDQSG